MRLLLLTCLVAAGAAVLAGGCGGGEPAGPGAGDGDEPPPGGTQIACTRASCFGGAEVRLDRVPDGAASAEVCVDGRCTTVDEPVPRSVIVRLPPEDRSGGPSARTAVATVEVRAAGGALLARGSAPIRLTALRPNGPRCTPTCWRGEGAVTLRRRAAG